MKLDKDIIGESIQTINEMWSVSDAIKSATDSILQTIQQQFVYGEFKRIAYGICQIDGNFQQEMWGHKVTINYTVYDILGPKNIEKEVKKCDIENHFSSEGPTLVLTIIAVNEKIDYDFSEDNVYHEVVHLYQWCLNTNKYENFQGLTNAIYGYARDIIDSPHSPTNPQYVIACLVYYSNPREQDAYAHEYYAQSKRSPTRYSNRTTNTDMRLEQFQNYIEWFQDNYNNPKIQEFIKPYRGFGYNAPNLLKYFIRGYNRFAKKLDNVEKRIRLELCWGKPPTVPPTTDNSVKESRKAIRKRIVEEILRKLKEL